MKIACYKNTILTVLVFASIGLFAEPKFTSNTSMLRVSSPTSQLIINDALPSFDGTLRVDAEAIGRVVAGSINFDRGVIRTDAGAEFFYTGVFTFSWFGEMFISDGGFINFSSGRVDRKIIINANTTAEIIGAPDFAYDVTLTDSSSILNLGIQSKFSKSLKVNAGKVVLKDDLKFQKGSQILGSGTLDVGGQRLRLPGGTFSDGALTYLNATNVYMDGDMTIDQDNVFQGASGSSNFNGNGFLATFASGGKIKVDSNHILYLTNLHVKDIGDGASYGVFDIDSTSTLVLQDCTLELGDTYTHSAGTIEFRDGCKVVHHGKNLDVTGLAFICLNGASLTYDSLREEDKNPFTFTDKLSQKLSMSGGEICSSDVQTPLLLSNTSLTFNSDYMLSLQSDMAFSNATPGSPKAMTADFQGHSITFPRQASALLNLDPNVNLTLTNAELFEYNQDSVTYGDANASLSFGAGTKIRLLQGETISSSDKPWVFVGDAVISGKNSSLKLDGAGRITVGSSSTLTFEDLRITVKNVDSIQLLDPGCKVVFDNCDFIMGPPGFEFDTGDVNTRGRFRIFGGDEADSDAISTLTFSSTGTWMVICTSLMRVGKNVEFLYKADPANDGGSVYASKRHFLLEGATSVLELDGCCLHSTTTGLALDYGKIVVSDATQFVVDGSAGTEAEFGSALDVYIKPSTSLTVTGTLSYNLTSLP